MKILITGANGYLGARLTQYLVQQGHEVIASVRRITNEQRVWSKSVARVIVGDVCNPDVVQILADCGAEVVIHTVSLDHKASQEQPTGEVLETNVAPAWSLLQAFSGKGLKKFLYFSTQQIYGRIAPENIDESYAPAPVNAYGVTHLMTEDVCTYFNTKKEVQCTSIRLSNSFGAPVFLSNNCWWLVVNDFCRAAVEKGALTILSDGSPQRDFIAIADVCRAVDLLVGHDTLPHAVYNLGSGTTLTILELAHKVAEVFYADYGKTLPILFADGTLSERVPAESAPKFSYDISRFRALGYTPQTTLEDGIREVFHFLHQSR